MLDYLGLSALKDNSLSDQLSYCWDRILRYFLTTPSQHYLEIIPTLLHNLLIVEFYSIPELLSIIKAIGELEMASSLRKCELIYMCSMAVVWVKNRLISRYPDYEFKELVGQAIVAELTRVKPHVP
jgi:hypothetical protein